MNAWQEKILKASHRVEELCCNIGRQVVNDMRDTDAPTTEIDSAYARVYYLRRELGRVVAELGAGVPSQLREIEGEYKHYLED